MEEPVSFCFSVQEETCIRQRRVQVSAQPKKDAMIVYNRVLRELHASMGRKQKQKSFLCQTAHNKTQDSAQINKNMRLNTSGNTVLMFGLSTSCPAENKKTQSNRKWWESYTTLLSSINDDTGWSQVNIKHTGLRLDSWGYLLCADIEPVHCSLSPPTGPAARRPDAQRCSLLQLNSGWRSSETCSPEVTRANPDPKYWRLEWVAEEKGARIKYSFL